MKSISILTGISIGMKKRGELLISWSAHSSAMTANGEGLKKTWWCLCWKRHVKEFWRANDRDSGELHELFCNHLHLDIYLIPLLHYRWYEARRRYHCDLAFFQIDGGQNSDFCLLYYGSEYLGGQRSRPTFPPYKYPIALDTDTLTLMPLRSRFGLLHANANFKLSIWMTI